MTTELDFETLTPAQRAAVREMLLPDVLRWRAEDAVKEAKRRHEGAFNTLTTEQRKFAEVEAAEMRALEGRLAKLRVDLNAAETAETEAAQVLADAERDLAEVSSHD